MSCSLRPPLQGQFRRGPVRGTIVDDNDFHSIQEGRLAERAETVEAWRDEMLLIICGNDN
jgi:hypothetical protein